MSYFVTGTDTGVGKTLISCALLHGFAAQGKRVVGMKPVAAGCNADGQNEDALQLLASGNIAMNYELINPYCFLPAIAPHIAAQHDGVEIQFTRITEAVPTGGDDLAALLQVAAKLLLAGAAGCNADDQNEDALHLRAAGNVAVSYGLINPY